MSKYMRSSDGKHTKLVGNTMIDILSKNGWTETSKPLRPAKSKRQERDYDSIAYVKQR